MPEGEKLPRARQPDWTRWILHCGKVVLGVAALAVALSFLFSWLVETRQLRTVLVDVETTRLSLVVEEEQAVLPLPGAVMCLPRSTPRRGDVGFVQSCRLATSFAVAPGEMLPAAEELATGIAPWGNGATLPENFVLDPPAGTVLEFEIFDQDFEIAIRSLPESLTGGWLVPGARLILPIDRLEGLGIYQLRAQLGLGSPPGATTRGFIEKGTISFKAPALLTYRFSAPAYITLREETVQVAGHVTFLDLDQNEPTVMRVQVIGQSRTYGLDDRRGWFRVHAVNIPGPTAAILDYAGTEQVRLVPLWTDVVLNDPFVLLLTVISTLTGLGTFRWIFA